MTLFIKNGAHLKGSDNTDNFPIHTYRWEGQETECYASLISAGIGTEDVHNLVIGGSGTVDANGVTLSHKETDENKDALYVYAIHQILPYAA